MTTILMNNIFRCNNYIEINDNINISEVPYFVDFSNSDYDLKALLIYGVSNVLENVLLFDKVYIDIYELPILINELYKIDKNVTKELIEKGWISTIIMNDLTISAIKRENTYYLASLGRKKINISNEESLKEYINSYSKNEKIIDINYKTLYDSSLQLDTREICEIIVNKISYEIKKGKYTSCGIGFSGTYKITDQNKCLYDSICQFELDSFIANKLNIDNIYFDDFLSILKNKISTIDFSNKEKFKKILNLKSIPDISKMLCLNQLSPKDIARIKNKKKFKNLIEWLDKIEENELEKRFIELLECKGKYNSFPTKILRFIITNGIGVLSSPLGLIFSIGDNILDSKLESGEKKIIYELEKKSKKKDTKNKNYFKIPVKEQIVIDTSEEIELAKIKTANNQILIFADKIEKEDNINLIERYYFEAHNIYNSYPFLENFIALTYCMINFAAKSKLFCKCIINEYPKMLERVRNKVKDIKIYDNLINEYITILINGISFDLIDEILEQIISLKIQESIVKKLTIIIIYLCKRNDSRLKITINKFASVLSYLTNQTTNLNKDYYNMNVFYNNGELLIIGVL